ncbi:MAG: rhodanese-like domain-containing protein [Sphaerochaetaceae bacterium]|jgi:rhodanese-related sulfurtransferase
MKQGIALGIILLLAGSLWASASKAGNGIVTPQKAKAMLDADASIVLLDVRTMEEYASGHIPGALLLPYDSISALSAAKAIPSTGTKVIVYCRTGRRSAIAAKSLKGLGYQDVLDLGGIQSWPYEIVK